MLGIVSRRAPIPSPQRHLKMHKPRFRIVWIERERLCRRGGGIAERSAIGSSERKTCTRQQCKAVREIGRLLRNLFGESEGMFHPVGRTGREFGSRFEIFPIGLRIDTRRRGGAGRGGTGR